MTREPNDEMSLDALLPHEPRIDSLQQAWLKANVSAGDRVLDLGCGCGRTLIPMAESGAICTGLDHDANALDTCRGSLDSIGTKTRLVQADAIEWLGSEDETWNVVCCLGNTFCQFWQIDQAIELLTLVRQRLVPGGFLVIDDIPGDLWPELAEGNWQSGLDPEQGRQLVWSSEDAVFAIRSSSNVDENDWEIGPNDVPLRLWTSSTLLLVARLAGYSVPLVPKDSSVRVLTPNQEPHLHP